MALFNDRKSGKTKKKIKTPLLQYGTAEKARATIRRIHKFPKSEQKRLAYTMYFRAKYNRRQTKGMRAAMKVYAKFLKL
jgi:hypothetical protein